MKLFLIIASIYTIASADSVGQGGYSGGGGNSFQSGGSFNFGNGGYTTGFGRSDAGNSFGSTGGYSSGPGSISDSFGSTGAGGDAANAAGQAQGPQVFKYVSVHAAPEDPEDRATKTLRVPGGGDKHVNIIFVKAPSNGADQKTEIVLPEQDEHKNLVYVLVQKTDVAANLQIKRPQPTKPSKPEVYFIRYKNGQQGPGGDAAIGGGAVGVGDFTRNNGNAAPGGGPSGTLSPAYGAP